MGNGCCWGQRLGVAVGFTVVCIVTTHGMIDVVIVSRQINGCVVIIIAVIVQLGVMLIDGKMLLWVLV